MNKSDIAIWLAIASAAFTAGGLVWQFFAYRLSGPRLVVRLTPAVISLTGTIVRGPEKGFGGDIPSGIRGLDSPLTVDLAEVSVANIGRMPISVSQIALDLGRVPPWWRCGRHIVTGAPIKVQGSTTDPVSRLESGDSVHVLFELWPLVDAVRRRGQAKVTVRGSAQGSGRDPQRSPWRKRWVFDEKQHGFREKQPPSAAVRAYRALWSSLAREKAGIGRVGLAWAAIHKKLDQDLSGEELAASLESVLGPGQQWTAHLVHEAYRDAEEPTKAD